MKLNTIQRKKARGGFEQAVGRKEIINRMYEIIRVGKQELDGFRANGVCKEVLDALQ